MATSWQILCRGLSLGCLALLALGSSGNSAAGLSALSEGDFVALSRDDPRASSSKRCAKEGNPALSHAGMSQKLLQAALSHARMSRKLLQVTVALLSPSCHTAAVPAGLRPCSLPSSCLGRGNVPGTVPEPAVKPTGGTAHPRHGVKHRGIAIFTAPRRLRHHSGRWKRED